MPPLWIVDRNPRRRAALARLAAAGEDAVLGAPGDPRFESAAPPETVLLGLDGDWEVELQFAHAIGRRAADALWVLVGDPGAEREALMCFDTRRARFLAWPPRAEQLRAQMSGAGGARPPSLSERARRDALSSRFARWFGDLDLPDLLRALDPRLAEVPLRIVGEPGTGRSLIARYVHLFGGTGRGSLAHVPCEPDLGVADLAEALARPAAGRAELAALAVWLEDVERLQPAVQRALRSWLECGPPPGTVKTPLLRWIATCDERHCDALDPDLRLALSGLVVRLPTLRERPEAVSRIAAESVRAWCTARGERTRRLGEDALRVLEEYPWPCNLRELEAVIAQSLAATSRDPLGAEDLLLDGEALAPTRARELEDLLPDEPPRRRQPFRAGAAPASPPRPAQPAREEAPLRSDTAAEPVATAGAAWPPEPAASATPADSAAPPAVSAAPEWPAAWHPDRPPLEEPLDELELETFLESLEGGETGPVRSPAEVAPGLEVPVLEGPAGEGPIAEGDVAEAAGARAGEEAARAEAEAPEPAAPAGRREREAPVAGSEPLGRLLSALARSVRSPLATVRAFAEALPERFADPEFRERFVELVREDLGGVDGLILRLGALANLGPPRREKVDVSALLEELLDARRTRIREQRLLVLKELDSRQPHALCDATQLRFALETLLDKCLAWVPPQGDVYLASRHHEAPGPGRDASVRVLLRFHDPASGGERPVELSPDADLELMISELVVRAQGGTLGVATKDADETLIVLDLPAP